MAASAASAADFRVIDLDLIEVPPLSGTYYVPNPLAVNSRGQVVGTYDGNSKAFLWSPFCDGAVSAGFTDLHGLVSSSGGDVSAAYDINDDGVIVGYFEDAGDRVVQVWDGSTGVISLSSHAIGSGVEAYGVNDESPPAITGRSRQGFCPGGSIDWQAFRLRNGSVTLLPGDCGNDVRNQAGVNDDRVVGSANDTCNPCPTVPGQPCVDGRSWTSGGIGWTGDDLDPIETDSYAEGFAINDDGRIVGISGESTTAPLNPTRFRPIFWNGPTASSFELPAPANDNVWAYGISEDRDAGGGVEYHIVGTNESADRALLWRGSGSSWTLDDLFVDPLGSNEWTSLVRATAVSTNGIIVGRGLRSGTVRAFVAVPFSSNCSGDVSGPAGSPDGQVDFTDLLAVLASWGETGSSADLAGDADLDGDVDFNDLLVVQTFWGTTSCEIGDGGGLCGSIATLENELAAIGLTLGQWDDYVDVLVNGTETEKNNWTCWFNRYYTQCTQCPRCSGPDPFLNGVGN